MTHQDAINELASSFEDCPDVLGMYITGRHHFYIMYMEKKKQKKKLFHDGNKMLKWLEKKFK